MLTQLLGWIGAVGFGFCGAPQAYHAYKNGHSNGLTWGMLGLWTLGEISTFIAIILSHGPSFLVFNYVLNGLFLAVMLRYKIKPRGKKEITSLSELTPEEIEFELTKIMIEIEKMAGVSVDTQKRILGGRNDN